MRKTASEKDYLPAGGAKNVAIPRGVCYNKAKSGSVSLIIPQKESE